MRKRGLLVAAVAVAATIAPGCSKLQAPAQSEAGAYKAAKAAYYKAETSQQKAKIGEDYLGKYPGGQHAAGMASLVIEYEGHQLKEPDRAFATVDGALQKVTDPEVRFEVGMELLPLSYEVNKPIDLDQLVQGLEGKRPLTFNENLDVMEAAAKHERWQLAEARADLALGQATPETYRADHPNSKAGDAAIKRAVSRRSTYALAYKAWALFNLGHQDEAMSLFKTADKDATFNYLGVCNTPLRQFWGEAELAQGNWARASELLEPSALFGANDTALADLRKAYAGRHGSEAGFDAYQWKERERRARKVDDFKLPDYKGTNHKLSSLEGKVTYLAFWFPT
jgi:hypothetical protein